MPLSDHDLGPVGDVVPDDGLHLSDNVPCLSDGFGSAVSGGGLKVVLDFVDGLDPELFLGDVDLGDPLEKGHEEISQGLLW